MTIRFNNLTVARFAAALLVYLHHSTPAEYTAMSDIPEYLLRFVHNGYVGVSFFFIVSGFVLAASNLGRLADFSIKRSLSFYWKRVARIVPLWFVVSLPLIYWAARNQQPQLFPFLTFTQAWHPEITTAFGLLGVSWTLSVEMFFYLMFPFIAAALKPFSSKWAGPVVVLVGLSVPALSCWYFANSAELMALQPFDPNSSHFWLYRFPLARLGEFIAGIGIFLCVDRLPAKVPAWSVWAFGSASVAALVYTMATIPIYEVYYVFPNAIYFAGIVAALAYLETLGASVTSRPLILLGEASFAFYLVHQYYFKGFITDPMLALGGVWVSLGYVLVIAIATSVGLFLMIETPCRDFLLSAFRVRSSMPAPEVIDISTFVVVPSVDPELDQSGIDFGQFPPRGTRQPEIS